MNFRNVLFVFTAAAAVAGSCLAADQIKTTKMNYFGTVTKTSPTEVSLDRNGTITTLPVNEIVSIVILDGEPDALSKARADASAGRLDFAEESLGKVKLEDLKRDVLKSEYDYLKAYVAAKKALAGNGDVAKAGSAMIEFVKNHPDSFHLLEANETIGDLLVAGGKYDAAAGFYEKLTEAPWPDYQTRAKLLAGKAKLAEGKTAEARTQFQAVIDSPVTGIDAVKVAAELGIARCLAAEKKYDEAITAAKKVIAAVDPEDASVSAQAYNTLGTALNAAGNKRDALMAFLHVDVLYFNSPKDHAEALENLAQLWTDLNRPERAMQVKQVLKQRYGK